MNPAEKLWVLANDFDQEGRSAAAAALLFVCALLGGAAVILGLLLIIDVFDWLGAACVAALVGKAIFVAYRKITE
jgi:hypothetical protein